MIRCQLILEILDVRISDGKIFWMLAVAASFQKVWMTSKELATIALVGEFEAGNRKSTMLIFSFLLKF